MKIKMFSLLIVVAYICVNPLLYGQQIGSDGVFGTNKMVFHTKTKTPDGYTGSPYLNQNFLPGVLKDDTGKSMKAYFRYDVVEDIVEVKIDKIDDKPYVLPKLKSIVYELEDYTIFIDQFKNEKGEAINGYMLDYYSNKDIRFLARPYPDVIPAEPAKTGYDKAKPAHLDVDIKYYIQKGEGRLKEVRLKEKDFKSLFSDKDKMDAYFKRNKIKDENDVIEMLTFYVE